MRFCCFGHGHTTTFCKSMSSTCIRRTANVIYYEFTKILTAHLLVRYIHLDPEQSKNIQHNLLMNMPDGSRKL
jgi:hypothetical protein